MARLCPLIVLRVLVLLLLRFLVECTWSVLQSTPRLKFRNSVIANFRITRRGNNAVIRLTRMESIATRNNVFAIFKKI